MDAANDHGAWLIYTEPICRQYRRERDPPPVWRSESRTQSTRCRRSPLSRSLRRITSMCAAVRHQLRGGGTLQRSGDR
jgi:hypothetical protein